MTRSRLGRASACAGTILVALAAAAPFASDEPAIRGAWRTETYVLKDGTRHPVRGLIFFTDKDWTVLFFVTPDGQPPQRGSGEGGTYTLAGNRLVFSHHYNLSAGKAVKGIPESPLRMEVRDAAAAPSEPCTLDRDGDRLTIHFPSGNSMIFRRSSSMADAIPESAASTGGAPPIAGQVTFLYYQDLPRAADFYGRVLGLRQTFDLGWVKIYALSPSSSVGLVDGASGALRPSGDKPVMVSLVVDDVDRWYEHLKSRGVAIGKQPSDGSRVPVRSFSFKDPEGYTIEVFKWLDR